MMTIMSGGSIRRIAFLLLSMISSASVRGDGSAQLRFNHKILAPEGFSQTRQIADFNNDGQDDVLVVEGELNPTQMTWYEFPNWKIHDMNNAFLDSLNYVADSAVADLDKDGDLDVIIPDAHDRNREMRVVWLENPLIQDDSHSAEWTAHVIANLRAASYLKDIEVADFNRDGKVDAAVRGERDIFLFYQSNPESWKTVHFPIKGHEGMACGDIDRDGYTDLVLNGFWLRNPGKSVEAPWIEYVFDSKWFNQDTGSWMDNNAQVRVADINRDGLLDILIANSEKPGYPISWYMAPGDPHNGNWIEKVIGQLDYCHTLQPADFDNDGDTDVLAAGMKKKQSSGEVVLFLNESASRSPATRIDSPVHWNRQDLANEGAYWAVVGDIGGDGDTDIVSSRGFNTPPIEIWENTLCDESE